MADDGPERAERCDGLVQFVLPATADRDGRALVEQSGRDGSPEALVARRDEGPFAEKLKIHTQPWHPLTASVDPGGWRCTLHDRTCGPRRPDRVLTLYVVTHHSAGWYGRPLARRSLRRESCTATQAATPPLADTSGSRGASGVPRSSCRLLWSASSPAPVPRPPRTRRCRSSRGASTGRATRCSRSATRSTSAARSRWPPVRAADNRRTATTFTASAAPTAATVNLRVDDGAVVYVNGVEAARFNLPDGPVGYGTAAPSAIYGSAERTDRASRSTRP